jgi:hypothetical protein
MLQELFEREVTTIPRRCVGAEKLLSDSRYEAALVAEENGGR